MKFIQLLPFVSWQPAHKREEEGEMLLTVGRKRKRPAQERGETASDRSGASWFKGTRLQKLWVVKTWLQKAEKRLLQT